MKDRNKRPEKLLWIDLEMTGLDPETKQIIEVGVIVTDFDYNELESWEVIIHKDEAVLESADEWVKENLGANGLFDDVRKSEVSDDEVQNKLINTIEKHFDTPAVLAGNSIHQDRRFIRKWWPKVDEKLHYRMLDVSSFKVYMMGKHNYWSTKPEAHRALEDIKGSIEELKAYEKYFEDNSKT